MRRKVIQHFANTLCQRVIDLPEGNDIATFARYCSGGYRVDFLTGICTHNGKPVNSLMACEVYKKWLIEQSQEHGVPFGELESIIMDINVNVQAQTKTQYGQRRALAHFQFDCRSEIRTDEKTYVGRMCGEKTWSLDWYYERLYGPFPDSWPQ